MTVSSQLWELWLGVSVKTDRDYKKMSFFGVGVVI